jgi:hypothetical protein
MALYAVTYVTIRDASWSLCADELDYPKHMFDEESARSGLQGEEKRNVHLALLTILSEMAKALDSLVYQSEVSALNAGASYAEVGAARGLSRQAVRQRHVKISDAMNKRRHVVLVGGPFDQQQTTVRNERFLNKAVAVYRGDDEYGDGRWSARYEQSGDDATIFLFKEIRQAGEK